MLDHHEICILNLLNGCTATVKDPVGVLGLPGLIAIATLIIAEIKRRKKARTRNRGGKKSSGGQLARKALRRG